MPILIAEDNEAQRHYLRDLLEREFSEFAPVIEARDGQAGARAQTVALRTRYSDAGTIRSQGSKGYLARIPDREGYLLDSVSARNLYQRNSQDSEIGSTSASLRIHSKEQSGIAVFAFRRFGSGRWRGHDRSCF